MWMNAARIINDLGVMILHTCLQNRSLAAKFARLQVRHLTLLYLGEKLRGVPFAQACVQTGRNADRISIAGKSPDRNARSAQATRTGSADNRRTPGAGSGSM
jgi:hypothetical protein